MYHRAWLSHDHLHSAFIIGAIVRRQQELLCVHRYPAHLLPLTWVRGCIDHLLRTIYLVWCCIAVLVAPPLDELDVHRCRTSKFARCFRACLRSCMVGLPDAVFESGSFSGFKGDVSPWLLSFAVFSYHFPLCRFLWVCCRNL